MKSIKKLPSRNPLLFLLLIVLGWYCLVFLGSLGNHSLPIGPNPTMTIYLVKDLATLVYILIVAIIVWRAGWLHPAGITRFGGWQVWLAALGILIYTIPTELYAFFGNQAFQTPYLASTHLFRFYIQDILDSPYDKSAIFATFVFSTFGEIVFRGMILYAFTLAWGKSKAGLLAGAGVSALLCGLLSTNLYGYSYQSEVIWVGRLSALLSGIWFAALVLRWGSIWPGVILSTVIGVVPMIPTDFTHLLQIRVMLTALVRFSIFEIPLVLFGIWLLLRTPARSKLDESATI